MWRAENAEKPKQCQALLKFGTFNRQTFFFFWRVATIKKDDEQ